MTNDSLTDWNELWDLFHEALALSGQERQAFVSKVRSDSDERGAKLEKMLAAHASVDEAALPSLEPLLGKDAATQPIEPAPGDLLGPYEIREPIGVGGMGAVYLAVQTEPVKRSVALKLLHHGMATRDLVTRFSTERQALALMSHSNIARIFDAGLTDAGRPYFVMEYVPGPTITDYCDSRKLDVDARLRLFLDVCDGVFHAHQKGIIHRDIKPSNVLVTEENDLPVPKIIDFGLAKATEQRLSDESLHTRVGTLIGTPGYMSPEQAGVVDLDVDIRADVYSLGVLLYELLVGVLPFEATTSANGLLEIQQAIRDEEPQRPGRRLSTITAAERSEISENRATRLTELERHLHSDVEWILLKAMDKNRERRYPSAAELAAEITRFLDGMPILARPPTRRYRVAKFVRRHTFGVAVASLAAVTLIVFAVAMTLQSLRLHRALEETTLERNRAEQVSDFMVELFEAANPEVSGRNDVTAAEILEEGASRIRQDLANQPEMRARLSATVAETYRVLGGEENAATAISLLDQSLADLESLGARAEKRAAVLVSLGTVYHDTGDFDDAEVNYRRALNLFEPEEESALRADALGNLSVLKSDRGELDEAEEYARASLAIQTRIAGAGDPKAARLKQRLAWILHQKGESDEAQQLIIQSLDVIRNYYGESHPSVATALNYAAIIQGGAGDHAGARQSLIDAIAIYRATHGDQHPYLATTYSNLAIQYKYDGEFEQAVESLSEALRLGIAAHGADHPNVNSFRVNLGATLQDMGRFVEAEPVLREGLVQDRISLAPGSPFLLATIDRYAATLARLGHYADAEPLLREAADMRREHLDSDNPDTGVAILNLALARLAQGAVEDAERLIAESLELQRSVANESNPLARSLAGLGRIRQIQGRSDEARDLLDAALAMFGESTKNILLADAHAWQWRAEIEQESDNLGIALQNLEAAESVLLGRVHDEHPDLLLVQVEVKRLQCGTSSSSHLAAAIRSVRPDLERSLGPGHADLGRVELAVDQCR